MPRDWSADLQLIHQAYKRRDTLDVYLSDGSALHLSRGKVERTGAGGKTTYQNYIRSVEDLRGSIETAIDRIDVRCQNVNSELGFNLASNLRLLDYAVCDYGRIYQSVRNPTLIEDTPQVFRGVLANAEVDEQNFNFELIVDYESLGAVVANRGLSPRCWFTLGNGIECTSSSLSCSKSRRNCIKNHNGTTEHEFGGWEFWEQPPASPPGSGGNEGDIGTCFGLETEILLPNRSFPIGDLPLGRLREPIKIVSFNEITGEIDTADEIEEVFEHDAVGFYTLEFEHGAVNVTPEHLFFTNLNQWRAADKFALDDVTMAWRGEWRQSKLLKIKWNSDAAVKVRNLHVRRNHTYFAGGCAVHNRKDDPGLLID